MATTLVLDVMSPWSIRGNSVCTKKKLNPGITCPLAAGRKRDKNIIYE